MSVWCRPHFFDIMMYLQKKKKKPSVTHFGAGFKNFREKEIFNVYK